MALVVVLGVISIALALAYTSMRTQVTSLLVLTNEARQGAARQAAHAGMSSAMQKMHSDSWGGIGSTLSGTLNDTDSYEVTFATGDDSLSPTDPDWHEFPYRVTIHSTGFSADPANPSVRAKHQVRAVTQLVRRKLADPPDHWPAIQQRSVVQWSSQPVYAEMPFRVSGRSFLQGPLRLFDDYPYKSKPFHGAIDEVAIFPKALTRAEIQAIYQAAIVTGDASGLPDAIGLLYAAHSPQAWWRFNEGPGAQTAAASAGIHNGKYVGALSGVNGAPNTVTNHAAYFDGVNDYVDVGKIDVIGNAMTILAWFKADSFGFNDGRIISKATSPSTGDHYWMLSTIGSGGQYRLRFRLKTWLTTKTLIASSGALETNKWIFAAAVYDGSKMKIYKDGMQVGSTGKSGLIGINPLVPVYIGDNPPGSTRGRYLRDLARMNEDGVGDHRPFEGPIDLPRSRSSQEDLSLLSDDLKVALNDVAATNQAPLSHPQTAALTYRLYPGGKTYSAVEIFSSYLSNTELRPQVETNPLGLFYREGSLEVRDNVSLEGTLVVAGIGSTPDLHVNGEAVNLRAADVRPLHNSSEAIRLPVLLVKDDLRIHDGSNSQIDGVVAVWDDYEIRSGSQAVVHQLKGHLIARELKIRGRSEWASGDSWWRARANHFLLQLGQASPIPYFPMLVDSVNGLNVAPQLTIDPPAGSQVQHWNDWDQPIFVKHPDDEGLRWDLIEWTDQS